MFAMIDDCDAPLAAFRWCYHKPGYASRTEWKPDEGRKDVLRLHQEVIRRMGLTPPKRGDGLQIDHKNRDRLDCRRENLRIVSCAKNAQNRTKNSNNTSGYKGVHFCRHINKFQASIRINGLRYNLGYYEKAEDAARAYDLKISEAQSNHTLNFPKNK